MDVIKAARELGKAMQQDERFIRMNTAQQENDEDSALQELIGEFNLKRLNLNEELNKKPKDELAVARLNEEVKGIYGTIMENANMQSYNEAKTNVDTMVDFVMQILRGSISGEDPDAIEPKEGGCSGSCDSCSGCH